MISSLPSMSLDDSQHLTSLSFSSGDDGNVIFQEEGDLVTIDGFSGCLYSTALPLLLAKDHSEFQLFLHWIEKYKHLTCYCNASSLKEIEAALVYGSEGIGCFPMESLFLPKEEVKGNEGRKLGEKEGEIEGEKGERTTTAKDNERRKKNDDRLDRLRYFLFLEQLHHERPQEKVNEDHDQEEVQSRERENELKALFDSLSSSFQDDFIAIFHKLNGLPITFRLLNSSLSSFFPSSSSYSSSSYSDELFKFSAKIGGVLSVNQCDEMIKKFQERNPFSGCHGSRSAIIHSSLLYLQLDSLIKAILTLKRTVPSLSMSYSLLIPFVFSDHEVDNVVNDILSFSSVILGGMEAAKEGISFSDLNMNLGVSVETPRACIRADKIAANAAISFLSFDCNALTELMFGLSKDDSYSFMVS
jgi:phosphoenolpyruvate synthase/pyruvate phosphate dikinase